MSSAVASIVSNSVRRKALASWVRSSSILPSAPATTAWDKRNRRPRSENRQRQLHQTIGVINRGEVAFAQPPAKNAAGSTR
jgi:hypothetical protein